VSGWNPWSFHFFHFVTVHRHARAGLCRRRPRRRKGGIAGFQRISGLAAHARFTGREGDTSGRGEGDDEGDSLGWSPLAGTKRAARAGEKVQWQFLCRRRRCKHKGGPVGQRNIAEAEVWFRPVADIS